MADIIHKDLSYKLNGIFFYVHNKLGRFCSHSQYVEALGIVLNKEKIKYQKEVSIPIEFSGRKLEGNRIDLLVGNLIPIDVKAKKFITQSDYVQMKRYLKATNLKLGIIVNFRDRSLKPKRIINSAGRR